MNISILVDLLRPNGAGMMALLQGKLLAESGHRVSFIIGAASDEMCGGLAASGYGVSRFLHSEQPLDQALSPTDYLSLREGAWRWIQSELGVIRPDVLCVHNCGRLVDQHMVADLSRQLPVVLTMHDDWFLTDSHYRLVEHETMVRTFEPHRDPSLALHEFGHIEEVEDRSDRLTLLAPSAWLHQRSLRRFPTLRCIHLRNPVDPVLFDAMGRREARALLGIDLDVQIVTAIGNPTQARKGFGRLSRAMKSIDGPEPVLMAVGGNSSFVGDRARRALRPGPLTEVLTASMGEPPKLFGYERHAWTVGQTPRSMMRALYGASDLVVHPSLLDNLPTVPIEAGLVGTRCLATNVGGTSESIAEEDGLFSAHITDRQLADLISRELDRARHEDEAGRAKRRQRQLDRFAPEAHLSLLEPLLKGLAGQA